MKVTKRAKRLEKALTKLGWETQSSSNYICGQCGHKSWDHTKFCPDCGSKMPEEPEQNKSTFVELEKAIAYALEEINLKAV